MSEATIVRWICREGDPVAEGDSLVEVETEKANADVSAPSEGVLVRVLAEVGAVVPVGEVIAILETDGNPAAAVAPTRPLEPKADGSRESDVSSQPEASSRTSDNRLEVRRASPLARRIARELGVDIHRIPGTGRNGLVTEADVRAAATTSAGASGAAAASLIAERSETLSGMRRAIATAMSRSLAEAAQLTLMRDVGMSGVVALRERSRERATLTDVLIAVVAEVLTRHPRLNGHLVGDEFRIFKEVNIGIAVALDDGLVTPVIRDVPSLSLEELSATRQRLVEAARNRTLRQSDLEDGTFTITNLGAYGVDAFTPIINPPQVGILGVGALRTRPSFVGEKVVPRQECVLSLTFDHRAIDGAPAALFLAELADLLDDQSQLEELLR
jgi:pyruvate dehydrogenase E2 component (dihydrolipoamide acetyltransferase)